MLLKKIVEQKPLTSKKVEDRLQEREDETFKISIEKIFEDPIKRILEILERRQGKAAIPVTVKAKPNAS